jgi:serine/threonine protein kinase
MVHRDIKPANIMVTSVRRHVREAIAQLLRLFARLCVRDRAQLRACTRVRWDSYSYGVKGVLAVRPLESGMRPGTPLLRAERKQCTALKRNGWIRVSICRTARPWARALGKASAAPGEARR